MPGQISGNIPSCRILKSKLHWSYEGERDPSFILAELRLLGRDFTCVGAETSLCFFPTPAQPHFTVACFSSLSQEKSLIWLRLMFCLNKNKDDKTSKT